MKVAILEMSYEKDAEEFKRNCRSRRFDIVSEVIKRTPELDDVAGFFKTSPDWAFFSGHLYDEKLILANDPRVGSGDTPTVSVKFGDRGVAINVTKRLVSKSTGEFQMHKRCKMTMWTGCEALVTQEFLDNVQTLFGQHLLLGYKQKVGWKTNLSMVTRWFNKLTSFDENVMRSAWIDAGTELHVIAGALDSSGSKWFSAGQ